MTKSVDWSLRLVVTACLATCLLGAVISSSKGNDVHVKFPDIGQVTDCEGKSENFKITWTPKQLSIGDTVTANGYIKPARDLIEGGWANFSAFLEGVPHPAFASYGHFKCEDVQTYVPWKVCPLLKDRPVIVRNYKYLIKPSEPVPVGKYSLRFELFDNNKKRFGCFIATLELLDT